MVELGFLKSEAVITRPWIKLSYRIFVLK